MATDQQKIKCPKCGESISIDDVLAHQIEEKIRKDFSVEQKNKEEEIKKQKGELEEKELKLNEKMKSADIEINKKVADRIASEKVDLWKKAISEAGKSKETEFKMLEEQLKDKDKKLSEANAEAFKLKIEKQKFEEEKRGFETEKIDQIEKERKKIEEEAFKKASEKNEGEKKLLEEQLAEKDKKLREANENELEIRKAKVKLEQEKKDFELVKQRELDEARKSIEEEASKKATEEQQYIIAQLNKKLADATKAKDELARKLEQGSQQLQGEVQELDIEKFLREHFIYDEILPVPKGVSGADVLQKVISKAENFCGSILWESKHTKNWTEGWIAKLKEDQREAKADIAVIITDALPKDVENVGLRNGVWIANRASLHGLATALRNTLTQVAFAKLSAEGKDEKIELLFRYLTGPEFKQKVEAMVELFSAMKLDLEKEKKVTLARWGKQEKQIEKIATITIGMHSNLRGLIGKSMESIPALEAGEESDGAMEKVGDNENEEQGEDSVNVEDMPF